MSPADQVRCNIKGQYQGFQMYGVTGFTHAIPTSEHLTQTCPLQHENEIQPTLEKCHEV